MALTKTQKQLVVKFATEGFTEVLQQIQSAGKNYGDALQGTQTRLNALKQARQALLVDEKGNAEAIKQLDKQIAASGVSAATTVEAAFKQLNIESEASLRAQQATAQSAFEAIKLSGTASLRDVQQASKALEAQTNELNAKLLGTEKGLTAGARAAQGFKVGISGLVTGFAGFAAISAVGGLVTASKELDQLKTRLTIITGSNTEAARSFQYLSDYADKLGLDLKSTANGYAIFLNAAKSSGLTTQQTRTIFEGFGAALARVDATAEQSGTVFQQLAQALGKGKLTLEDLRPIYETGAVAQGQLAAAAGLTTAEFAKQTTAGKLNIEKILEIGSALKDKFEPDAVSAAKSATSEFNRFGNEVLLLEKTIAESGFLSNLTKGVKFLTDSLKDFNKEYQRTQTLNRTAQDNPNGGLGVPGFRPPSGDIPVVGDPFPSDPNSGPAKIGRFFDGIFGRKVNPPPSFPKSLNLPARSLLPPPNLVKAAPIIDLRTEETIDNEIKSLQEEAKKVEINSAAYNSIQDKIRALNKEKNRYADSLEESAKADKKIESAAEKARKAREKAAKAFEDLRTSLGAGLGFFNPFNFGASSGASSTGFRPKGIFGGFQDDSDLGKFFENTAAIRKENEAVDKQLQALGQAFRTPIESLASKGGGIFGSTFSREDGTTGNVSSVGGANEFFQSVVEESKKTQDELEKNRKAAEAFSKSVEDVFSNGFSRGLTDFVTGTKSAGEAFSNFTSTVVSGLIQIAAQSAAKSIFGGVGNFFGSIFGGGSAAAETSSVGTFAGFTDFGSIFGSGKASGGLILGPGTSTSDSILTPTSFGEYVLPTKTVDRVGLGALNSLRAGATLQDVAGSSGGRGGFGGGQVTNNWNIVTPDVSGFRRSQQQIEFDDAQRLQRARNRA